MASLDELRTECGGCEKCGLGKTRTNLVFGVGDPGTKLMFVGEGPGRDEDLQGEPSLNAFSISMSHTTLRPA